MMKHDGVLLATAILFSVLFAYTNACSCMPAHPQQQFCWSDFVILARVKRARVFNETTVYKVRVRKEYKVSEKGVLALKAGRLITPTHGASCGAELQVGKMYVISGHIFSLRAHIYLCGMNLEWKTLTRRQRKGLKLLYKLGCSCSIKMCNSARCYRQRDSCFWSMKHQCEVKEGTCLRQHNDSCMWTRTKALNQCRRDYQKRHLNGIIRRDTVLT